MTPVEGAARTSGPLAVTKIQSGVVKLAEAFGVVSTFVPISERGIR